MPWRSTRISSTIRASAPSMRVSAASCRSCHGASPVEARVVNTTASGEEGQVDCGGDGPMVREPSTGKYKRVRLFVLTLGYSRKCVRLLTWRSSARNWAELHQAWSGASFYLTASSARPCALPTAPLDTSRTRRHSGGMSVQARSLVDLLWPTQEILWVTSATACTPCDRFGLAPLDAGRRGPWPDPS